MFLSVVFVWFGSWLAGFGQIFSMNISVLCHQLQHIAQHFDDLLSQQQRRQQRLQGCVHIGAVDADRFRQIGVVVGAQGGQSLQVVAQHLSMIMFNDGNWPRFDHVA